MEHVWKNVGLVLFTKSNRGGKMMENVTIKLNGRAVSAPVGSTILEAAHLAGIKNTYSLFLERDQ